jgi:hypothetical protein
MTDRFLTFQKFNDPELATTIAQLLESQNIHTQIVNEAPAFDVTFANNDFEPTIHLKLLPGDFSRANTVLESYYESQLANIDPDYYLFSFTDAELLNLVKHPDEWGHLDYALAKQLLARHGRPVTMAEEEDFQRQRLKDLKKTESTHPLWIIAGYIAAFAGSIFGLIFGYVLGYMKKTLPNGELAYVYSLPVRRHGKRILLISAICFPVWLWGLLSSRYA